MLAKINLTKEKVCKFFGITELPCVRNGYTIFEKNKKFFITGKGHYAPAIVQLQIEFAFMKSGCPYLKKDGQPVIQALKSFEGKDITHELKLLGYKEYSNNTMYFPKKRYIGEMYERKLEKALSVSDKCLQKHRQKAYSLMCATKSRELYKRLFK